MSDAEDNEAQTTDSLWSLHENLFLGNLKCLGWYSLWCEFFTLLVEMDTDTDLMDDCFKYVDDMVASAYFFLGSILITVSVHTDREKVSTKPLIILIKTLNEGLSSILP